MSHCANYLLRKDGVLYQGNSRWGSKSLVRELVWGPAEVYTLLAEQTGAPPFESADSTTRGWIYSEVMTEGAVLADYDARRLLAFGGEDIRALRTMQLAYEQILRCAWPGWRVDYAMGGWGDVAREAGVPIKPFDDVRTPDAWTIDARLVPGSFGVVTVLGAGVPARHVHVSMWDATALAAGPALLDAVAPLPSRPLEAMSLGAMAGAIVDARARRVRYWAAEIPALLDDRMRASWPGWDVARAASLFDHAALAGESATPLAVRMGPLREQVVGELTFESPELARLVDDLRERAARSDVVMARGATEMPRGIPRDRRAHLAALVATLDPDERLSPALRAPFS
jgi:hypothetical protein